MNPEIMRACGFGQAVDNMERGCCSYCGKKIEGSEFRDNLCRKEYTISGMCHGCQDETFGREDGEEE